MYQSTTPCPKCGYPNLRGTWICAQCGNTLLMYCPHCRAGNETGSQFCHACGAPITQTGQASAQQGAYGTQQAPYGQYPPQGYQDAYGQPQYPGQPGDPGYYPEYGQPPAPSYPRGGDWQDQLQNIQDRIVNLYKSVNPILLLALGTVIICIVIFVVVAFQFGWIKTGTPQTQQTGVKDTTPPQISFVQVEAGNNRGAIISWVTDEESSSQIRYGPWPYASTITPIENDPTTGVNTGVKIHKVGLPSLIPKTTYIYHIISIDKYGNKIEGPEMQFQTTQ